MKEEFILELLGKKLMILPNLLFHTNYCEVISNKFLKKSNNLCFCWKCFSTNLSDASVPTGCPWMHIFWGTLRFYAFRPFLEFAFPSMVHCRNWLVPAVRPSGVRCRIWIYVLEYCKITSGKGNGFYTIKYTLYDLQCSNKTKKMLFAALSNLRKIKNHFEAT